MNVGDDLAQKFNLVLLKSTGAGDCLFSTIVLWLAIYYQQGRPLWFISDDIPVRLDKPLVGSNYASENLELRAMVCNWIQNNLQQPAALITPTITEFEVDINKTIKNYIFENISNELDLSENEKTRYVLEYIYRMRNPTMFGTDIEIGVLAHLFKVNIRVTIEGGTDGVSKGGTYIALQFLKGVNNMFIYNNFTIHYRPIVPTILLPR